MSHGTPAECDFIIPVYNEGPNIAAVLAEVFVHAPRATRVLVVYDFDEDDTIPVVRGLAGRYPGVKLVKNVKGRGVLNAIRTGIAAATAEVVIISMADLSDELTVVPRMINLVRNDGFDIVCASRYVRGGRQIGGPWLKGLLSRAAGVSLHWLVGLPTHDATNAFRAYRRSVLVETEIESTGGFEYSIELTVKAFAAGRRIAEVPSTWRDRSVGQSRFRFWRWLPHYLRWYAFALTHRPKRPGMAHRVRSRSTASVGVPSVPQ